MDANWFYRRREFLITGCAVVASLLFLGFFTESSNLNPVVQSTIVSLSVFLVLPFAYCKIVLKKPVSEMGWQTGSLLAGIGGSLIALVSGLVLLFFLVRFTPLFQEVRLPVAVENNFFFFILYEILLNGLIALMLETYFRGFIMFLWLRSLGFFSVILQSLLVVGLFYLNDDITAQTIPILLFSPLAGLIAFQSRSILASWVASWFFLFLSDAIFLIVR